MREFPLLFCFKNVVVGNRFIAGVMIKGRALLVDEEDDLWMMYGVNPGGMAAEGETREEAMNQFRVSYDSILNELAADCRSFKTFKSEVDRFFHQISDEAEWVAAVEEVRRTGEAENWDKVLDADTASFGVTVEKLTQQNAAPRMNRDPREKPLLLAAQMSPSGQLKHKQVWKMLDKCAPGWTKIEHDHDWRIDYNGLTFWNFPLGNRKMKTKEVQIHWVRKLAKTLKIEKCAKRALPQIA